MADIAPERLTGARSGSVKKSGGASQPEGGIWANRNIFLIESGSGVKVNERKQKEGLESEKVHLSDGLRFQYTSFLDNYVQNLQRLVEMHPTALDGPWHEHDKKLLEMLKNPDPNERRSNIDTLLRNNPEVWKLTTLAMEHQMALQLFALGINAFGDPRGERRFVARDGQAFLNVGRGVLNKALHDRVLPNLKQIGKGGVIASSMGAGGVIGNLMIGTAAGTLVAAGAGLAPVALLQGIHSLRKEGLHIDLEYSRQALDIIKRDPREAAYVNALVGIDVNDFDTSGGLIRKLRVTTNKPSDRLRSLDPDKALQDLVGNMFTRQQFYTSLGIPPRKLDALPEQFIFSRGEGSHPEQTRAEWQKNVIDEFEKAGGAVDSSGRHPGERGYDYSQIERRHGYARRKEMLRIIQQMELSKEAREVKDSQPMKALAQKKTEFTNGTEKGRRTKEANDRKKQLEDEKEEVERQRNSFNDYENHARTMASVVDQLTKSPYSLMLQSNPTSDQVSAAVNAETLRIRQELTTTPPAPPGFQQQLNEQIIHRAARRRQLVEQWTGDLRAKLGPEDQMPPGSQEKFSQEAEKQAELEFADEISRLEGEVNPRIDRGKRLTELSGNFRDAARGRMEEELKILVGLPREMAAMRNALDRLIRPGGMTPTITETDLENQTMDELIRRVETDYGVPNATPEEQADLRRLIIRAKTESRARRAEAADESPRDQKLAYTRVTSGVISPDDLATRSDQELLSILNRDSSYVALKARTPDLRGELARAKTESNKKRRIRHQIDIDEQIKDKDRLIKAQEARAEHAGNLDKEVKLLTAAGDVMGRAGTIYEKVTDIIPERGRYFDNTLVAPTDTTLTPSERAMFGAATAPRGYLELMDFLFDYKQRADREGYFTSISSALPPQKLGEILNTRLGLLINPATPNLFVVVLDQLRLRTNNSRIGPRELRDGMRAVVHQLRDEALAA